jgi:predicted metalloprotease with PDZ domain
MTRVLQLYSFLLILLLAGMAAAQQPFQYQLSYLSPGADLVSVEMQVTDVVSGAQILVIPRAIPMGYTQEPYDRFIGNVAAWSASGEPLMVQRGGGPRWIVGIEGQTVSRIRYEVDIATMEQEIFDSSDASKRRSGYLSLLGYSVFAYLDGLKDRPVELRVEVPEGWPVTTTLAPRMPAAVGNTTAEAEDFYALADSQILAGPDARLYRLESSTPLYLALYAEGDVDVPLVIGLIEETMAAVVDYFGSAPFPHFTVVQELLRPISERHNYNYSMEHLLSATFYLSEDRGVTAQTELSEIERTRFNYAHHFAHAWIPKRISGEGYRPFNWELAPVLDTIWFSEGFAQYLAMAALAERLSPGERQAYLEDMVQKRFRDNLDDAPLFSQQMSLAELSRSASTLSSHDFRTLRNISSRGGMMAAEMDALIREKSAGKRTLRDGLRFLMNLSERERRAFDMSQLSSNLEQAVEVDVAPILDRWQKPLAD